MNAFWNKLCLEHPPNATWHISAEKFDVKAFLFMIDKIIKQLRSMDVLHVEAALLSRLIYRMKSKFRSDKGLKYMEKVNRALINYLTMSLEKEYTHFRSYIENENEIIVLPSRQMFEYVLVRTQGFVKLMARIEEVARYSAHCFKSRIKIGHAWTISIIAYSVISRIWLLSQDLIKKICKWYKGLYEYLETFPIIGLPWLPKDQSLPQELTSWLALEWLTENIPCASNDKNWRNTTFKLLKARTDDSYDDVIDIDNETGVLESENITSDVSQDNIHNRTKNESALNVDVNDIGEIIDRNAFKASLTKKSHETGISVKKRKCIQTSRDIMKEELEDVKSSESQEQKERKEAPSNNASPQNTKRTNKIKKQHRQYNDKVEQSNKDILTLNDITTKSELIALLNRKSYPDIDKLRWNMIRNNAKKYLVKLKKCRDNTEEIAIIQKATQHLRSWTH